MEIYLIQFNTFNLLKNFTIFHFIDHIVAVILNLILDYLHRQILGYNKPTKGTKDVSLLPLLHTQGLFQTVFTVFVCL